MKRIWFACLTLILVLTGLLLRFSDGFENLALDSVTKFLYFYASFALVQVLSFGGSESFRLACGRLTSLKKLKFSAILSILLTVFAGGILIGATMFVPQVRAYVARLDCDLLPLECTATVFALLRVCSVWFSARNQKKKKICLDILAPIGILALFVQKYSWLACCIESLLLILCLIWVFVDKTGCKASGAVLKAAKVGILRAGLYPILGLLVFAFCGARVLANDTRQKYLIITLSMAALLLGDAALFESREYFRVDRNTCAKGLLLPTITGFACFFAYWIADIAGHDLSAYMPAVCVYLSAAAVWGILYAPMRKLHLGLSMLCACVGFPMMYISPYTDARLQAVLPLGFLLICIFGCDIIQILQHGRNLHRAMK